jgi:DNA-binding NarL/FixJ family response regulator
MPVMDGFETYQNIKERFPHIKTAILTLMRDTDTIKKVIRMGAQGYFTKNTPPKELEDAIWNLKDNGFYFEQGLASVIDEIKVNLNVDIESLEIQFTERELEIIELTAKGVKPKDIANKLSISTKTINAHKQNIQRKYNFPDMMSAILYCVKYGIIDLNKII